MAVNLWNIGDISNGQKVVGFEDIGFDPLTGRNAAWDELTDDERRNLIFMYEEGRSPWANDPTAGGDVNPEGYDLIPTVYGGYSEGEGWDPSYNEFQDLIYNYKESNPIWEDLPPAAPNVDPVVQTDPDPVPDPNPDSNPPTNDGGAEDLGNPEGAPPDPGLHAVNDYLIPGETDVALLQAYDLWGIDDQGYTQEDVEEYNEGVRDWNAWMRANRTEEDDDWKIYDELEWHGGMEAPRDTEWQNLMADKIDVAQEDGIVDAEDVSNIFANGIYFGADVGDLTSFIDEQTLREQRIQAREDEGYLSMNQTFGLSLGDLYTYTPGLY